MGHKLKQHFNLFDRKYFVMTPTLTGSGPLVLQISRTKRIEFPLKLGYIQA